MALNKNQNNEKQEKPAASNQKISRESTKKKKTKIEKILTFST